MEAQHGLIFSPRGSHEVTFYFQVDFELECHFRSSGILFLCGLIIIVLLCQYKLINFFFLIFTCEKNKLTCAGGVSASVFQLPPAREAHIKNPNNKTVPEGVMQGLVIIVKSWVFFVSLHYFNFFLCNRFSWLICSPHKLRPQMNHAGCT